jgi:2-polyprenyl-6-methoxyphenol hydroxylase-like FAD-dependent oxidoreductase
MNITTENKPTTQHLPIYDVIISGAGPVGLFLAGELALAQCTVLVLEKAEDPHSPLKQIPFGMRGLSAPTIEALYRRGLLDELTLHKQVKNPSANTGQATQRPGGHFAGIVFQGDPTDTTQWPYRLPGSPPASLMSEIAELETVLTRRATALGVDIRRGFPVTGFHQTTDGVTVLSGDHTFEGKWLVGCDGSRSVVRKTAGFEFAGTEPAFTGYSTKVDIAGTEQLKPGRNVTPQGMYMQSQPGYVVIQDFDNGAFHSSGNPITREHVQEILRRISGTDVTINTLHFATTWTDRSRQATAYRKDRVLLAGDAAHIHSPLGGQGLNLGLGDAMNLGWKLAATIRNNAPEYLLDSYYTERYPTGAQVLDWSRAQVAIMKPTPEARALYAIMRDLINTPDGATYMAGRVWGINNRYNTGNDHPLTGRSAPDFELEDGTKPGALMTDGRGILLDFNTHTTLKTFAGKYGHQIRYVSGKAKEQFGLNAILIRPDGIVAWVAGNEADYNELPKVAARWFTCPDPDLKK